MFTPTIEESNSLVLMARILLCGVEDLMNYLNDDTLDSLLHHIVTIRVTHALGPKEPR
jgi:hypothetical protein